MSAIRRRCQKKVSKRRGAESVVHVEGICGRKARAVRTSRAVDRWCCCFGAVVGSMLGSWVGDWGLLQVTGGRIRRRGHPATADLPYVLDTPVGVERIVSPSFRVKKFLHRDHVFVRAVLELRSLTYPYYLRHWQS